MMAEPIKSLELHYIMTQFLVNIYNINNNNNITLRAKTNGFKRTFKIKKNSLFSENTEAWKKGNLNLPATRQHRFHAPKT